MNKFRFGTGNPIESENLRDFTDNLKNADLRLNSLEPTFTDRLGNVRLTIEGERLENLSILNNIQSRLDILEG